MDDLITDFLVESFEIIERVDLDILQLERGEATSDTLASIFRGVHTIKGTCGFLGMERLEKVAHVGENVLSRLRDGELVASEALATSLFHLLDRLREILVEVAATGEEPTGDDTALLADLNAWLEGGTSAAEEDDGIDFDFEAGLDALEARRCRPSSGRGG